MIKGIPTLNGKTFTPQDEKLFWDTRDNLLGLYDAYIEQEPTVDFEMDSGETVKAKDITFQRFMIFLSGLGK